MPRIGSILIKELKYDYSDDGDVLQVTGILGEWDVCFSINKKDHPEEIEQFKALIKSAAYKSLKPRLNIINDCLDDLHPEPTSERRIRE